MSAPRLGGSIAWITFATMAAAFMALADISIVNINLPQMQSAFGVDIDQLGWVSTAYMIANVVTMPMTGWLQRRFGFRASFALCLTVFTVGSALCGSAWSFETLVLFRIVQGLGGGGLLPLSQSILAARYPPHRYEVAAALFGVGALLGPVVGPYFGAQLLEHFSWPWVFWINVPVGAIACFATWRALEEPHFERDRRPFDRLGAILVASGLASMQFVLEEGNRREWTRSPIILLAGGVAVAALGGLVWHTLRAPAPIIDLRVFRSTRLAAASVFNFVLGAWMIGGGFLNALFFSNVLALPPLRIGELLFVGNASDFIVIPVSAWLYRRLTAVPLIVVGVTLIGAGFWTNAVVGLDAGFWDLVIPQLIRSAGASLIYVPISIASVDRLSDEDRESAVGLYNLMRELGASIAIAIFAHLLIVRGGVHREAVASLSDDTDASATHLRLAARLVERAAFEDVFFAGGLAVLLFVPFAVYLRGIERTRAQRSSEPQFSRMRNSRSTAA